MDDQARLADKRIPITLLTGFLGSGKTTLLQKLLAQSAMARTALVVNEFGEVGIDHLLLARSSDNVVEISNGCLCCAAGHDLVHTLFGLYAGARNGNIPPFDRVIIETTGLAEPAPILEMLAIEEPVARRYRINGVITVVDLLNAAATLDHHPTASNQIAAADLICLTKSDLSDVRAAYPLHERITALNPDCQRLPVRFGELAADHLFCLSGTRAKWAAQPVPIHSRHTHAFSRSWTFNEPATRATLLQWMNRIRGLGGANLLRLKGLVNVDGRPLAIHAVQHFFHPPEFLPSWPTEDRRSHVVAILNEADGAIDDAMRLLLASPSLTDRQTSDLISTEQYK